VVASASASPDDELPIDKSCVVVASTASTYDDLSDDEMYEGDTATIDDPSVEVTNLNRKVFQINVSNFLVTY